MSEDQATAATSAEIERELPEELHGRGGQEDIRLLTGFTDIFSAIVLGWLFVFVSALAALAAGFLGGLLVAAAAWFLAPYFVTKRRFAACAILLAVAFGLGITATLAKAVDAFAPLFAAAGLWFFWRHYKVPLSAALAIAFATLGPVLLYFQVGDSLGVLGSDPTISFWVLLVGVALFAAGIWWDLSDRERTTRRSDVGFWLHLMAGPLTVHGTFSLLKLGNIFTAGAGLGAGQSPAQVWPVFLLVAVFAVVAIGVERRPLLIASFGYLVVAIGVFAYSLLSRGVEQQAVGQFPAVLMIATMGTGALIVVLAGAWTPIRRFLLALLPGDWTARLAPLEDWALPDDSTANLPAGEKEPLRLIHGLNDYMAAVGMFALFIGSLAAGYVIAAQLIAPDGGLKLDDPAAAQQAFGGIQPWLVVLVPMVVVSLLAGFFVRYRRMALTGVAASFQFWMLTIFAVALIMMQANLPGLIAADASGREPELRGLALLLGCVLAAGANFAFWWFNKVPIAFALGFSLLFALLFPEAVDQLREFGDGALSPSVTVRALVFGLIAFAVAMVWDRRDPARSSQRADNAFWMHLLAALFAVPAAYTLLGEVSDGAALKLLFFVALIGLALLIDRRALLLVALPTLVGAIATGDGDALGLGGVVLLFAGLTALNLYWDQVRSRVLPQRALVTGDGG